MARPKSVCRGESLSPFHRCTCPLSAHSVVQPASLSRGLQSTRPGPASHTQCLNVTFFGLPAAAAELSDEGSELRVARVLWMWDAGSAMLWWGFGYCCCTQVNICMLCPAAAAAVLAVVLAAICCCCAGCHLLLLLLAALAACRYCYGESLRELLLHDAACVTLCVCCSWDTAHGDNFGTKGGKVPDKKNMLLLQAALPASWLLLSRVCWMLSAQHTQAVSR